MRSHLEFRSAEMSDGEPNDSVATGETVARLVANALPAHGFVVDDIIAEDWGWCVMIAHDRFPLWIGCGVNPEYSDGHLCFIEPSKPYVRRWFRRIATREVVERLAVALEQIISDSGKAHHMRWWNDDEAARG